MNTSTAYPDPEDLYDACLTMAADQNLTMVRDEENGREVFYLAAWMKAPRKMSPAHCYDELQARA